MNPVLLAGLFTLGLAQSVPFVPIAQDHGVTVYYRKGAPTIELGAEGEIDAPIAQVQSALLDYAEHRRISPRLIESRVIARSDSEQFVYQRLHLPVIADRDYQLHVTWERQGSTQIIRFQSDPRSALSPVHNTVRITVMNGTWILEPIRDGRATRARYQFQIDFAGSVPRWMVSGGAAKDLPQLFERLRRMVEGRAST